MYSKTSSFLKQFIEIEDLCSFIPKISISVD